MDVKAAIEKAKSDSPKRNFAQSVDLFVNFKNLDFNKPENKLNLEVILPKGRGKPRTVCVICGDEMATNAKAAADRVISPQELEEIGKDKKKVKAVAEGYDAFISQANLMAPVGKYLGQVLGPRGKMPKPVPPQADLKPLVAKLRNTVIIKTKGKNLPVIHTPVGTEEMSSDDLAANTLAIISAIRAKVTNPQFFGKVFIKTTMGPVIEITEGF